MPTLDWSTVRLVNTLDKNWGFVTLPAFTVENVEWLGASEIVRQYNYEASKNFALRRRPTRPDGANFVLCIRFRINDDVFRYALWGDVDAAVGAPLYTGQIIKKNFALEIWNIDGETDATLADDLTIQLSIREVITDFSVEPEDFEDAEGDEVESLVGDYSAPSLPVTSGLAFRYNGDDATLSTWPDSSGNSRNITTHNGTLGSDFGIHNHQRVSFVNATVGTHAGGIGGNTLQSLYLVVKINTWNNGFIIFDDGVAVVRLGSGTTIELAVGGDTLSVDAAGIPSDKYTIIRVRQTASNPPAANYDLEIVRLDLPDLVVDSDSDSNSTNDIPTQLRLGTAGNGPGIVRIAEVLGYTTVHSDADDAAIKDFLAGKYFGVANFPIDFGGDSAVPNNP